MLYNSTYYKLYHIRLQGHTTYKHILQTYILHIYIYIYRERERKTYVYDEVQTLERLVVPHIAKLQGALFFIAAVDTAEPWVLLCNSVKHTILLLLLIIIIMIIIIILLIMILIITIMTIFMLIMVITSNHYINDT